MTKISFWSGLINNSRQNLFCQQKEHHHARYIQDNVIHVKYSHLKDQLRSLDQDDHNKADYEIQGHFVNFHKVHDKELQRHEDYKIPECKDNDAVRLPCGEGVHN